MDPASCARREVFYVRRVTVAQNQERLIATFGGIPDRQERLSALVDWAKKSRLSDPGIRTPSNRVPGCVSPVWIAAKANGATLSVSCDADSPVVKGLVHALCAVYDGTSPAEIVSEEPVVLETLELLRDLSPTRRRGLESARQRLRELASAAQPPS